MCAGNPSPFFLTAAGTPSKCLVRRSRLFVLRRRPRRSLSRITSLQLLYVPFPGRPVSLLLPTSRPRAKWLFHPHPPLLLPSSSAQWLPLPFRPSLAKWLPLSLPLPPPLHGSHHLRAEWLPLLRHHHGFSKTSALRKSCGLWTFYKCCCCCALFSPLLSSLLHPLLSASLRSTLSFLLSHLLSLGSFFSLNYDHLSIRTRLPSSTWRTTTSPRESWITTDLGRDGPLINCQW